ncbi:hypothetical protein [Halorubrum tibetense]|uniref:Uncharacterized protein n=1 Tax=Halorubrum tibetense TaxID=175631 RepID=A0ABD5S9R4_9EURY
MLDAGNPYVLPSAIVGAVVYLGVTALTDASLLVRLGVLLGIVGVVPVVLNRALGGGTETDTTDATESTTDPDGGADDPTPSTGNDRKTN